LNTNLKTKKEGRREIKKKRENKKEKEG